MQENKPSKGCVTPAKTRPHDFENVACDVKETKIWEGTNKEASHHR